MLRPYQQEASDAAIAWMRKSVDPCVIDAPTGAGKTHIIADLVERITKMTTKKILVLAPSKELVANDRELIRKKGIHSTLACSGLGKVSFLGRVVVGSPSTVANRFKRMAAYEWGAIIVDEAHGVTPTLKKIVNKLREWNPQTRIIGLSATPYRLGEGYIYEVDHKNQMANEDDGIQRLYKKCVYKIHAKDLVAQGFLTPPLVVVGTDDYDTTTLTKTTWGTYSEADLRRVFEGKQRLTAKIMMDVVGKSQGRGGVIIFASTVQHAYECLDALPRESSAIVHGKIKKAERTRIIEGFVKGSVKYLVNVEILTTGFDAPICDHVVFVRPTESMALFQQMAGRGYRLYEGKKDCLVSCYAGNIERLFPDGDILNPEVSSNGSGSSAPRVEFTCPLCMGKNSFSLAPNPDALNYDKFGFYVDLAGNYITEAKIDFKGNDIEVPIPAHTGRRCTCYDELGRRCKFRWSYKVCEHCGGENDIAAKNCSECGCELIDPNEKLSISYVDYMADPYTTKIEKVLDMSTFAHISRAGNECLGINFKTTSESFTVFAHPNARQAWLKLPYYQWRRATENGKILPETITYRKTKKGFYEMINFNQPELTKERYENGAAKNIHTRG